MLIVVALCTLLISACNTTEKLLCRQWEVTDVSFDPQNTLSHSPEEKANMTRQIIDTGLITVNKNKTYTFRMPDRTINGKWELKDKSTFITTTESATTVTTIKKLDKNILIVKSNENNIPMTFTLKPKH